MNTNDYQPEDYSQPRFEEGEYLMKIIKVEEAVSKSGNDMFAFKLITAKSPIEFKYWLVKNEHFNKNATRFFDCFGIRRGDFNINNWVGKKGKGFIAKGQPNDEGKSYFEIKYLIVEGTEQAMKGPSPVAQAQEYKKAYEEKEPFKDDIPF
jgi:hypothetical protein